MLELQLNSYNSEAYISSQNSLPQITDASKVSLLNINKYYSSLNNWIASTDNISNRDTFNFVKGSKISSYTQ